MKRFYFACFARATKVIEDVLPQKIKQKAPKAALTPEQ